MNSIEIDTGAQLGTAYGRPMPHHDADMTEVAAGTPGGEWLRRFWHPFALAKNVTTVPQNVKILGEDLIAFRDGKGRPGLLYPRCAHRGTSLYYGKCEDDGIRCCYHGWLFTVDGRCVDQPCEPGGASHNQALIRQPWYHVEERYGLLWTYMGPPDKKPLLPRYDVLEHLEDGNVVASEGSSIGAGGDETVEVVPCNWLQDWENVMDPYHVLILHNAFTGTQFVADLAVMPDVTYESADHGMKYIANRNLPDGRTLERVTQVLFPYVRIVPDPWLSAGRATKIGFVVPIDNTSFRLFHIYATPAGPATPLKQALVGGKQWSELSEAEHQQFPGDWEAQVGQGAIQLHSEEHLTGSDRGVGRLRAMLRQQIKHVAAGGTPLGVNFDEANEVYRVQAGNYFS